MTRWAALTAAGNSTISFMARTESCQPHGHTCLQRPAASLTPAQLKTNAFFDVTDFISQFPPDYTQDMNLFTRRAAAMRNCSATASCPIRFRRFRCQWGQILVPDSGIVDGNFDMMTLENGWPAGRAVNPSEANRWHHSDFQQVAYTFTYKLFNQFVNHRKS